MKPESSRMRDLKFCLARRGFVFLHKTDSSNAIKLARIDDLHTLVHNGMEGASSQGYREVHSLVFPALIDLYNYQHTLMRTQGSRGRQSKQEQKCIRSLLIKTITILQLKWQFASLSWSI